MRRMRASGRTRSEAGFTLPELIIAVSLLGIIALPVANLLIQFSLNSVTTNARLHESHDAQMAGAYFAQDVAALGRRDSGGVLQRSVWTSTTAGAPYSCGTGTPVLLLAWDSYAGPGPATTVERAYVRQEVAGESRLVRYACEGPTATPVANVVAHNLDPSAPPTVSCSPDCTGAPTSVQLALTVKHDARPGSGYEVTLRGQRRQT